MVLGDDVSTLDDDDDDGLYFKTMCIKAAKACGVVYNN